MKTPYDYSIKVAKLATLFLSLIFASCHTNRQVSDYPNFKSPDQTKFGLQAKGMKMHSRQISKIALKSDSIPDLSALEKTKIQKSAVSSPYYDLLAKRYMHLMSNKPLFSVAGTNKGALTAALSAEPLITKFSFRSVTNRLNYIPVPDTNINKNTQSPAPAVVNDKNSNAVKQKNATTFAYISLVTALLSIPMLILALPGLFLLFAIAAIVFGALGLKSPKRKMAIAGMIIGISVLAIILLVFAIFFFSGGFILS